MKRYKIGQYTRISKRAAKRLYLDGKTIYLCAVNMNPLSPWVTPFDLNKSRREQFVIDETGLANDFDNYINSFEYYNCTCNETGRYTAFYIMED